MGSLITNKYTVWFQREEKSARGIVKRGKNYNAYKKNLNTSRGPLGEGDLAPMAGKCEGWRKESNTEEKIRHNSRASRPYCPD